MVPTIVFDFDGVIHSYKSGWKGATVIPDPPVDGIREVLEDLSKDYRLVVNSSRCATEEGRQAIWQYLRDYKLSQFISDVSKEKPPAIVYVDDRAICFDGNTSSLALKIRNFEPWTSRRR